MLLLYIVVIFAILLLSYRQNKKIIFTPSFISCCSFVISALFLFILKNDWSVSFSFYTIFILGVGLFSMLLGESFYTSKLSLNITSKYRFTFNGVSSLYIDKWLVSLILIINFIGTYFYFKEVLRIIGGNIVMLSEDMSYYRDAIVFGGEKISRIVTQFKLFTISTSLVLCFIIIFNVYKGESLRKQFFYIIACIPNFINTFLSGGRLNFLTFMASLLWFVYIVNVINIEKSKYKKYLWGYGKKIFFVTVAMLLLFFSLRLAIGRITSADDSFCEYIGKYIAAPSLNLDVFLKQYSIPNPLEFDIHKSESFMGIGETLSIFDHKKNSYNPFLDFRYGPHGEKFGNVFTAFARYYSDFGILGIIFLPFVIGVILGRILSHILNSQNKCFDKKQIYFILVYGYLYNPLIIFAADDVFFRSFRHGTIEIIVLLYVMSKYVIKVKHRFFVST